MQMICPCCHVRFPLDVANQDESARELLALRGQLSPRVWTPLIAYLGLFRSETRALAWDRALRLAREVMELGADPDRLENALAETVEALRLKGGPPLKNHNYLKRVLETAAASSSAVVPSRMRAQDGAAPAGKRAAAIAALGEWAGEEWLRREIAAGLQALVAQVLESQPAAELITLNADVWWVALKKNLTIEEVDAPRIRKAFERLFSTVTKWPAPKQLLALLPDRPHRVSLSEPGRSDEEHARGLEAARNLVENYRNGGNQPG